MPQAAAFGRLCVETASALPDCVSLIAAAFGRLCVETLIFAKPFFDTSAAAFGRLCVETLWQILSDGCVKGSRFRAAVC